MPSAAAVRRGDTFQTMKTVSLLTPASVSSTGGQADLSILGYTRKGRVTLQSFNTAGTNPTLAAKLQHSAGLMRGLEQSSAGSTDNKLNSGATTNVNLGLKFTQSGARSVKRIALQLKNPGTITAGKVLTLAIKADSAGSPGATVLGTAGTVLCSAVAATYGWVVFTFATPVDLADATVYHLALSCDYTAHATNCIYWRSLTVASGGSVETFDNTNWAAVTATESFEVYVDQFSFSDVTGGAFSGATTGGAISTVEFNIIDLQPNLRVYFTIGGTSNPAYTVGASFSGYPIQDA